MIWFIFILLGVGLVFGALARLLVPGTDDGAVQAGGVVSSIIGAIVVLLIYRAVKSRN